MRQRFRPGIARGSSGVAGQQAPQRRCSAIRRAAEEFSALRHSRCSLCGNSSQPRQDAKNAKNAKKFVFSWRSWRPWRVPVCAWRGRNGTTTGSVTDSGVSKCGGEPNFHHGDTEARRTRAEKRCDLTSRGREVGLAGQPRPGYGKCCRSPNTTAQLRRRAGRFEPRRREDAKERRSNTSVFAFVWASRPRGFAVQIDAATTKLRCSAKDASGFSGEPRDQDPGGARPVASTRVRRPGRDLTARASAPGAHLRVVDVAFAGVRNALRGGGRCGRPGGPGRRRAGRRPSSAASSRRR